MSSPSSSSSQKNESTLLSKPVLAAAAVATVALGGYLLFRRSTRKSTQSSAPVDGTDVQCVSSKQPTALKDEEKVVLTPALRQRISDILSQKTLTVFIKGDYDQPFCKWSRRLMHNLADNGIGSFAYFNILDDKTIRAALPLYSGVSSYPQVYVNGKFIGGGDFVNDHANAGTLRSVLPAECLTDTSFWKVQLLFSVKNGSVVLVDQGEGSKKAIALLDKHEKKAGGKDYTLVDVSKNPSLAAQLYRKTLDDQYPQMWCLRNRVAEKVENFPTLDDLSMMPQ